MRIFSVNFDTSSVYWSLSTSSTNWEIPNMILNNPMIPTAHFVIGGYYNTTGAGYPWHFVS